MQFVLHHSDVTSLQLAAGAFRVSPKNDADQMLKISKDFWYDILYVADRREYLSLYLLLLLVQ